VTGRLFSVANGRTLYVECSGSGKPTVSVSAGTVDKSSAIRPQLTQMTRTCAYDRAGEGSSSDFARLPADAGDDLQDLEQLLLRGRRS
jgi:hypothetical protein